MIFQLFTNKTPRDGNATIRAKIDAPLNERNFDPMAFAWYSLWRESDQPRW